MAFSISFDYCFKEILISETIYFPNHLENIKRSKFSRWYCVSKNCIHMVLIEIKNHTSHAYALNTSNKSNIIRFSFTLSFLSCLAYGKHGITAVTREADAILHAFIIINNSIRLSFISPDPDCTMYTSSPRTDSPISTLQTENIPIKIKTTPAIKTSKTLKWNSKMQTSACIRLHA